MGVFVYSCGVAHMCRCQTSRSDAPQQMRANCKCSMVLDRPFLERSPELRLEHCVQPDAWLAIHTGAAGAAATGVAAAWGRNQCELSRGSGITQGSLRAWACLQHSLRTTHLGCACTRPRLSKLDIAVRCWPSKARLSQIQLSVSSACAYIQSKIRVDGRATVASSDQ